MSRDFPGTFGDRLDVGATGAVNITGAAISLACWVNLDAYGASGGPVLAKWHFADNNACQYVLWVNSAGKAVFQIGDGIGAVPGPVGATTLGTGTWRHIAGTLRSGSAIVFVDGVSDGSVATAINIGNTGGPVMRIGLDSPGTSPYFLDARVAEAAIWDVGLTDPEFVSLAKGFSPALIRPQNLSAYWPLIGNASPDPNLVDSSLNGVMAGTVPKADHSRIILPRSAIYTS